MLTVSPDAVSFDALAVGSSQDKTFTITNTGSAVLTGGLTLIASGSGAGVFTLVSEDTINVAPGQSQEVTVRYTALSNEVLLGSAASEYQWWGGHGTFARAGATPAAVVGKADECELWQRAGPGDRDGHVYGGQ